MRVLCYCVRRHVDGVVCLFGLICAVVSVIVVIMLLDVVIYLVYRQRSF